MKRIKVRPPHQWDDNDFDNNSGGSASIKEQAKPDSEKKDDPIGGPVEEV